MFSRLIHDYESAILSYFLHRQLKTGIERGRDVCAKAPPQACIRISFYGRGENGRGQQISVTKIVPRNPRNIPSTCVPQRDPSRAGIANFLLKMRPTINRKLCSAFMEEKANLFFKKE